MARKIIHQLVDDLDGSVLDPGEGDTVLFSLDGVAYEIDLTNAHAEEFRNAFASYIAVARTVSRGGTTKKRQRGDSLDTGIIRKWARENGYEVSDRGRVSATIRAAYEAAR